MADRLLFSMDFLFVRPSILSVEDNRTKLYLSPSLLPSGNTIAL